MLILLPPSEGKAVPRRGKRLSLPDLDFPELTEARETVLDALVRLCSGGSPEDVEEAARTLGLGSTQLDQVRRNADLPVAPTARADRIYTGVLYDALDLGSLDAAARRRATRWVVIMSSLFGIVRPNDPIASYRLSGDTNLPGVGTVATFWRARLDPVLAAAAGSGLVVDLRSSTYAGFWRPPAAIAAQVATVRVLHEVDGRRLVVSHFNKATKGRIVRALLVLFASEHQQLAHKLDRAFDAFVQTREGGIALRRVGRALDRGRVRRSIATQRRSNGVRFPSTASSAVRRIRRVARDVGVGRPSMATAGRRRSRRPLQSGDDLRSRARAHRAVRRVDRQDARRRYVDAGWRRLVAPRRRRPAGAQSRLLHLRQQTTTGRVVWRA